MAVLEVKSTIKAGKGLVINSQGLKMSIQVVKPKGLLCFIALADGKKTGLNGTIAADVWEQIIKMYGIKKIREPEIKKKIKNRLPSRKL